MASHVLLLTATVTPPAGVPALARVDVADRRADYRRAFSGYLDLLTNGVDRIVFAENSESDISDLADLASEKGAGDRVEFLSFNGLDYPPRHGRAHGEFRLIDHVVAHSATIRDGDPDQTVWKMTGRYLVKNLSAMIARCPNRFDLYCNLRDYPRRWADMFLMAWSWRGYQEFLRGLAPHFREDLSRESPEQAFRRLVDEARTRIRVVPRFRQIPVIDGIRGYDNKHYSEGSGAWKHVARRAALSFAPWFWI